jgi:hypothetical protein
MADVSDSSIMTISLRKRLHMKPVNRSVINLMGTNKPSGAALVARL